MGAPHHPPTQERLTRGSSQGQASDGRSFHLAIDSYEPSGLTIHPEVKQIPARRQAPLLFGSWCSLSHTDGNYGKWQLVHQSSAAGAGSDAFKHIVPSPHLTPLKALSSSSSSRLAFCALAYLLHRFGEVLHIELQKVPKQRQGGRAWGQLLLPRGLLPG